VLVLAFAAAVSGADFELDGSLDEWVDIAIHWSQPDGRLFLQWASDGANFWIALGGARVESLASDSRFELRLRLFLANSTILSYSEGLCALLSESWQTRNRKILSGLQWKVGEGFEFCIPLATVVHQRTNSSLLTTLKIWDNAGQSTIAWMPRIEIPAPMDITASEPMDTAIPVDPNSGKLNPSQRERALIIHRDAWNEASMRAESDAYFKYAVYTSRSLVVKHPEVYLQGDALFIQHVTSNPGYAEASQEQDPDSDRYYDGFPGPPLNLQHIDPAVFQVVTAEELYPQDAPFYPFVDRRLSPIASCLVTQNRNLTGLEKASLAYFTSKRAADELPFIIYCSNGQAYLATEDHLVDTSDGSYVEKPAGAPILIFNELHVWYPLMGRDDTAASPRLRSVVEQFRSERSMPDLTSEEALIVERLRSGTTLAHSERDLAILAAVRGMPWESELFEQIARGYLREYPLNIWVGIQLNWLVRANYLSPFAAFLGGILDTANLAQTVEDMVDRWHNGFGFRHGHVWQCGLVRYSIDEIMRVEFVHCVLHAASIAAILDLARIDNLLIKACFDDSGSTHTYVSIPSIGYVISNGEITERKTILNARLDGTQWNTLWYVSSGEKWAFPYPGFYCGTWAPLELSRTLEHLEGLYGDEIHGLLSSGSGPLKIYFRASVIRSEAYIQALKDEQLGWHPLIHP